MAQSSALIVLGPAGVSAAEAQRLDAVRTALVQQGVALLDEETSQQRTRRPGLLPGPDPARVQALETSAEALLEAAAYGRDSEVLTQGALELATAESELTSINHSDTAARALLDVCFLVVRAALRSGDEALASREAQRCAWRVPDLSPQPNVHPPEVIARAGEVRAAHQAVLRVAGSASAPATCLLRVQGRALGALPNTITLVPGRYEVQVDCGQPGFVHALELRAGQTVSLDLALDFEQRTEHRGSALAYAAARPEDDLQGLAELAGWLGVDELWVLYGAERPSLARLRRNGPQLTLLGTHSWAAASLPQVSAAASAVATLLCPDCAKEAAAPSVLSRRRLRAGLGLGAVAVAGVLTSWALWPVHQRLEGELSELVSQDPAYADKLAQRERIDRSAATISSVGAALLVAACVTGLPTQQPRPWSLPMIATLSSLGVASIVLIIGGGVVLSREGELQTTACADGAECLRPRTVVPLGPMLLSQGIGLLSLPLIYAWRARGGRSAGVRIQASSSSAGVWLRASL